MYCYFVSIKERGRERKKKEENISRSSSKRKSMCGRWMTMISIPAEKEKLIAMAYYEEENKKERRNEEYLWCA